MRLLGTFRIKGENAIKIFAAVIHSRKAVSRKSHERQFSRNGMGRDYIVAFKSHERQFSRNGMDVIISWHLRSLRGNQGLYASVTGFYDNVATYTEN